MPKRPAHRIRRRPPRFHPVPLRSRRDGWTQVRQCAFLTHLYLTGSVIQAARAVGMSRASAYRLRDRQGAESFARAWDHVLTPPLTGRAETAGAHLRKVTNETLERQLESGFIQPVVFAGRMTAIRRKADNSALFELLRRGKTIAARAGEEHGSR